MLQGVLQTKEDQNRAISGDVIAVEVLPEAAWLTQRVSLMNAMKKAVSGTPSPPDNLLTSPGIAGMPAG